MTDQQRGQATHTMTNWLIPIATILTLSLGMVAVGLAINDIGIVFGAILVGGLLALSSPLINWKDD